MHNSQHSTKACEYYQRSRGFSVIILPFPKLETTKLFIGRNLLTHIYIRIFFECREMFTQHMTSKTGKWLSADHTFKVSANIGYWKNRHWTKMFNSLFILMNEKIEVLAWQLTKGTSLDNVNSLLCGVKYRHEKAGVDVEGLVVDNCCTLAKKLKNIFGNNVVIKLGIFHAIKRILDKIPRKGISPDLRMLRKKMTKTLRFCFSDETDVAMTRQNITPSPGKIVDNLKSYIRKWSVEEVNDVQFLPDNAVKEIENIIKYARLGCLSGIPPGIGTNKNENLYKILKKWLKKDCIGIALAVAL